MKKVYCDRCGKEMEQNGNILLRKEMGDNHLEDYFDICDTCRDSFFGWLNNKPVKVAEQPKAKPSKKDNKTRPFTVSNIAFLSNAPESTVRRHLEGICSTYAKDKNGRTIRYYHMTDEHLEMVVDRIKNRQQGRRNKI